MQRTPTPRWRKSSYSGHSGGDCVEVANLSLVIIVRDSKVPEGPQAELQSGGVEHIHAGHQERTPRPDLTPNSCRAPWSPPTQGSWLRRARHDQADYTIGACPKVDTFF
ncbi:DUF397 domain-containing protein [Actinomadura viridis]|uniref:DUF397 domain-containing protein n=1 Tax=Actinomadura viridis TaxID=58110 RepID=UPI0036AA0E3C